MIRRPARAQLALFAALLATTAAPGQAPEPLAGETDVSFTQSTELPADRLTFGGGYQHRFKTDMSRGGDLQLNRYDAWVSLAHSIDIDTKVIFTGHFRDDDYEFAGTTGLGGADPWGDIKTLTFAGILRHATTTDWEIFGGPIIEASWEDQTDEDDSLTYGGVIGGVLEWDPNLTIGGGVGIITQLEDTTRYFPVIIIEWKINDRWRLTTRSKVFGPRGGGAELIYKLENGWEAGLSLGYERDRFRLDNDGVGDDGVGQNSSLPLTLRLSYRPHSNMDVNFLAGYALDGELELEDEDGNGLAKVSYDDQPYLGAFIRIHF